MGDDVLSLKLTHLATSRACFFGLVSERHPEDNGTCPFCGVACAHLARLVLTPPLPGTLEQRFGSVIYTFFVFRQIRLNDLHTFLQSDEVDYPFVARIDQYGS